MRVALLGAGTIARLALEHVRRGELSGVEIAGIAGRPSSVRALALAQEFELPCFADRAALLAARRMWCSRRLRMTRCASIWCRC
jgi:predicted dehydrogenase